MSYKKIIIGFVLALTTSLCSAPTVLAAGNSIYLSPGSKNASKDSTFSIAVRVNTTGANAVQANLTYPTDKLTYISTSYVGSAFDIQAESSGGGGSIHIGRGALSLVSGDNLVATISFRAAVSSGSGTIAFSGDSALVNSGASVSPSFSGATIGFTTPPPAPPAPVVDKTPPTISNLKVSTIKTTSAVVSWDTNEPADSTIDYGLDTTYGLTISSGDKVTHHEITLSSSFLAPKTTFHLRATSTDGSGNKQTDADHEFQTAGIPYVITVKDAQGKTIPEASVSVDGTTRTTNNKGTAQFSLAYGPQTVTVSYKNATVSKTVALNQKDSSGNPSTTIALTAKALPSSGNHYGYYALAVLVGIILGGTMWRLFPASFIGSGQWHFKKAKVSVLQKYYGDTTPDHNPYATNGMSTKSGAFVRFVKGLFH